MGRRTGKLLNFLRVGLALLFLFLALRSVSLTDLKRGFTGEAALAVVVASALYFLLQSLSATRWWLLSHASSLPMKWTDALTAFYSGMFFNLFLPGLVGGDAVRAYLVARKAHQSLATSLGVVYADRTLGLLVLIAVGIVSALAVHYRGPLVWSSLMLGASAVLFLSALLVFASQLLSRWLKGEWGKRVGRFGGGITSFLHQPGILLLVLPIAVLYHLSLIALLQMVGRAVGLEGVGFPTFALIVSAGTVIGALPVTVHGLGLREWAVAQMAPLLSIPSHRLLLWALLWRLISWLVCLPGGLVYLIWAERTVKEDLSLLIKQARQSLRIAAAKR